MTHKTEDELVARVLIRFAEILERKPFWVGIKRDIEEALAEDGIILEDGKKDDLV